ncbi:MAG TPA: hypothetical protein VHS57_04685 [Acidimicrobiales bacterium]|jgi:hypothetical protein|nr:hypothetical protein [Acidimicrobiales bacterium]
MKLFGRSSPEPDDPGEVHRIVGTPGITSYSGGMVVPPAPALDEEEPVTPVQTRLQRLAAVVERARPGRSSRNVRLWLEWIGMALIVFGFACIILGWYGAAHSPYLYEEIPYLISGGLLGVALVIGGGVLIRSAWTMRQIEEDRRNALAIVRSVDRLERILRSLDETRRVERSDQEEQLL